MRTDDEGLIDVGSGWGVQSDMATNKLSVRKRGAAGAGSTGAAGMGVGLKRKKPPPLLVLAPPDTPSLSPVSSPSVHMWREQQEPPPTPPLSPVASPSTPPPSFASRSLWQDAPPTPPLWGVECSDYDDDDDDDDDDNNDVIVVSSSSNGGGDEKADGAPSFDVVVVEDEEDDKEGLTALQRRFPTEDLVRISPEWRLEWLRPYAELVKEHLVVVPSKSSIVSSPEWSYYNGLSAHDFDKLREEVLRLVARKPWADEPGVRIERIGTQDSRRFVYAPCASRFCYEHDLILYGPWAGFVKRALRLPKDEELRWEHCMGIYVLFSEPGAEALAFHTDFHALGDKESGEGCWPEREQYLHKVVSVLVPLQALDEGMGFTVVLDGAKGRYPLRVREKGHWYALDPGYPHGADEYRLPPSFSSAKTGGKRRKEGEEGRRGRARGGAGVGQQRVLLNLSYVRKDFPTELRQHVVTHLYYYKQHLAPAELRRGAVAAGGK